jgi:uncharacterized membrane protein YjjP (DUF1212 family)
MGNETNFTDKVMDLCLTAGKIMLQSGAETYRVEDTMLRIASAFGIRESHSYVTPTGIIFSIEGELTKTKIVRVTERTTDLEKIAEVNSISRKICSGDISLDEAYNSVKEIESANLHYPFWLQIVSASIASGCFLIIFKGEWRDFIPAMIAGGVGLICVTYFHRLVPIRFLAEFLASFFIGFLSVLFVKIGFGMQLDKIIIGSVMPLVPGLLITNAVRDLMAGHLVSGLSKGAEAFLTAFAIGLGIAMVLSIM